MTAAGNCIWDATAISNFAALMASAKANGWVLEPVDYPSANWATLAASSPGPYAYAPSSGRGLFD